MPKFHANAATAVALLGMALLLAGCALGTHVPASSSHQAGKGTPNTVSPGYRLEQFTLRGVSTKGLEKPKRIEVPVSMLVPQDDCLALDGKGWLRVVPGRCVPMRAQSTCERKP